MSATDLPPQQPGGNPADPFGIEAIIASQLAQGASADAEEQAALAEGFSDEAIGGVFDPNFFGSREVPGMRGAVPAGVPTTIDRPFYKEGDQWRLVQSVAPEEYRRLQDRLAFIGLLDRYRPGETDEKSLNAIRQLLLISNRRGSNWQDTISEYEVGIQNGVIDPFGEEDSKARLPGVAEIPEYNTAARRVNNYFQSRLGRKATEAEMRMFTDQLMSDYRAAAIQERENAVADPVEVDPGDMVGAGRVAFEEKIDPVLRFETAFEERMGGQMDVLEQKAAVNSAAAEAQAAVTSTDQILGT